MYLIVDLLEHATRHDAQILTSPMGSSCPSDLQGRHDGASKADDLIGRLALDGLHSARAGVGDPEVLEGVRCAVGLGESPPRLLGEHPVRHIRAHRLRTLQRKCPGSALPFSCRDFLLNEDLTL